MAESKPAARTPAVAYTDKTTVAPSPVAPPNLPGEVSQPGRRDVPPPQLVVVGGPDIGKKLPINAAKMGVGRANENEHVVHDLAVSRRHFQLLTRDDGVYVVDLGSGNGTRVNGTRVSEVRLVHGDKIQIGNTIFRFEMPQGAEEATILERTQLYQPPSIPRAPLNAGAANTASPSVGFASARAPAAKKGGAAGVRSMAPTGSAARPEAGTGGGTKAVLYGLTLALLAGVGAATWQALKSEGDAAGTSPSASLANRLMFWRNDATVEVQLRAGVDLAREKRFAEAKEKFITAKNLDPENRLAAEWLTTVELEITRGKTFKDASDAVLAGELARATKLLSTIPADSLWRPDVARLRDDMEFDARRKMNEAQAAFETGHYVKARRLATDVRGAYPDNREALQLLLDLDRKLGAGPGSVEKGFSISSGGAGRPVSKGETPAVSVATAPMVAPAQTAPAQAVQPAQPTRPPTAQELQSMWDMPAQNAATAPIPAAPRAATPVPPQPSQPVAPTSRPMLATPAAAPPAAPPASSPAVNAKFAGVLASYRTTNVFQAIADLKKHPDAETPAGRQLMDRLKEFQRVYARGQVLAPQASPEAVSLLDQAARIDRELAPAGSKYTAEIQGLLARLR